MISPDQIIKAAALKMQIIAQGDDLTPDEWFDMRLLFSLMIDAWSNESLLLPITSLITHKLDAGSEYTIGDGYDPRHTHINSPKPIKYLTAYIRDTGGIDYPLEFADGHLYARVGIKGVVARPTKIYVRDGWPHDTLLFINAPYESDTLHIEVVLSLSSWLAHSEIGLPPGYDRALLYNFCLELADGWGKDVSNMIALTAIESKKQIKRNNYRNPVLKVDQALTSRNVRAGTYIISAGP